MKGKTTMRYRDELDKCYGVAGMALGLEVYEAERLYGAVTVDAEGTECVRFTPEFFFAGNPRLSARTAWRHLLAHFQVSVGLTIANALCRRMVLDNTPPDDQLKSRLLDAACDDGETYCQLERDEVQPIFDKAYNALAKLFDEREVRSAMDLVADTLRQRRTLTQTEVAEILQQARIM